MGAAGRFEFARKGPSNEDAFLFLHEQVAFFRGLCGGDGVRWDEPPFFASWESIIDGLEGR